jgi:hypothetical protein
VKRIRRWLFNGAAAVSLLMLIGISTIWVASYRKTFSVEHFYYIQPDGKPLAKDAILPSPVIGYMNYRVYATIGCLVAIRYKMAYSGTLWPEDGVSPQDRWGYWIDAPLSVAVVDYDILARGGSTRFGFGFPNENDGRLNASFNQALMFPDWFVALLFAILPAIWLYRWRRSRRRFAAHLCQTCGYDLRATPERCPECGTIPIMISQKIA